jgi:hypothetical protein
MRTANGGRCARLASILCISLVTTVAWAQQAQGPHQTLDRVDSFNPTSVLEMQFHDPDRTQDFINLGIVGTSITACKLTELDGLYCLDGKIIRHWPDTSEPGTSINEFSCGDSALQLASTNPCTAMTVGLSGAIYLAGRKTNSNNLIKVVAKPSGGCPSGTTSFAGGRYCQQVLYAGTPQLVDIDPIDGDVGAAFKACPSCTVQPGILGLSDKKSVVFFPNPKPSASTLPIEIANSQTLNLSGNEVPMSGAVLQLPNGSATDSYVLLTTSDGRILAKRTNATGSVFQAYNIPAQRAAASVQCNFDTQKYGIRTSTTSGHVYATDKNFCQVIALAPVGAPLTSLAEDLTLATASTSETNPPSGSTLAGGNNIDLGDCVVNCTYLQNEAGTPAASFVAVKLNSSESNATVFQIIGIPDCRQEGDPLFPADAKAVCDAHPEAVVTPPGAPNHPAAQLLNVTALFPHAILDLFDASGVPPEGLPNLLISRQYIATSRTDFLFDAFFYVTEPGVQFQDTFTAEFDVPVLEGGEPSLDRCNPDPGDLIAWDIMTNVNERYRSTSIDGDNTGEYVDTLTNIGCRNPTKTLQKGISLIPYNLAVNEDTYGFTVLSPAVKVVTEGNDAVFARLVQNLYDDLEFVRREEACKTVDATSGQPPISSSVCNTLASRWANGKIKLDSCIDAAFQPKQSTADQNCQSFLSQLSNYRAAIPATTPVRDIANRVGELRMRVDVINHVFTTRTLASMTTAGFCREKNPPNSPSCPDPWVQ